MRPRFSAAGLAAVLLLAGAALCARPGWHLLQEQASILAARHTWTTSSLPAAWLRIPDCGLEALVLHGSDADTLSRAAGLVELADLTVISAHRDRQFRRLARLHVGQRVELEERGGGTRRYTIAEIECVPRSSVERRLRESRGEGWLVLMTCHPFQVLGPAPDRLLAWARPTAPQG
jgi:LPXTG-site transpeptidase (sortase) family protein